MHEKEIHTHTPQNIFAVQMGGVAVSIGWLLSQKSSGFLVNLGGLKSMQAGFGPPKHCNLDRILQIVFWVGRPRLGLWLVFWARLYGYLVRPLERRHHAGTYSSVLFWEFSWQSQICLQLTPLYSNPFFPGDQFELCKSRPICIVETNCFVWSFGWCTYVRASKQANSNYAGSTACTHQLTFPHAKSWTLINNKRTVSQFLRRQFSIALGVVFSDFDV